MLGAITWGRVLARLGDSSGGELVVDGADGKTRERLLGWVRKEEPRS